MPHRSLAHRRGIRGRRHTSARPDRIGEASVADLGFDAFERQAEFLRRDHREDSAGAGANILAAGADRDVTVTVLVRVPKSTYQAKCDRPWHVRQVGLVEIELPVRANSAEKVTFSHGYNDQSGGGLASPYDKGKKE